MRSDWLTTSPLREITAMSVVPPPMSMTMLAQGWDMSSPQPIAAAIGSEIK